MQFVEIAWQSEGYDAAVALRYQLLRMPLGLEFSAELLADESSQLHFGLVNDSKLIACVVAVRLSNTRAKLRQMAVDPDQQRQGVGSQLIRATESRLREQGIRTIELNAREPVIGFYESLGYHAEGERFIEVTIEHQKMVKRIS